MPGFSGSAGKESPCNAGDLVLILGLGRSPGDRNSHSLQYWRILDFIVLENSGEFHGLYSSWIRKVSDMTEQPSLFFI